MVERPINKTAHTVEIFPGGRGHRTRAQVSGSQRIYPSRGGDQRLAAAAAAPIETQPVPRLLEEHGRSPHLSRGLAES
jgi:hypothetical protein